MIDIAEREIGVKEKESMGTAWIFREIALIKKELPKVDTRKLQYLLKDFLTQHQIKWAGMRSLNF